MKSISVDGVNQPKTEMYLMYDTKLRRIGCTNINYSSRTTARLPFPKGTSRMDHLIVCVKSA